ncbi:MAG TPA: bifunctional adenosylcobinamide kinase/adenosylcobinamide-phosphate guanylyltransferase [Chloroflexia bacterium]|nr:bifunctional adenosylcobinamide kinase/adenosylcobinamide-phosphate guanylyltransferase [Chloroflexia bacterium]
MSMPENKGKVTLILGGARSGKSALAEKMAQVRAGEQGEVLYVATMVPFDDELKTRVANHQNARPASWHTLEAPYKLFEAVQATLKTEKVVLVDCLTVWAGNRIFQESGEPSTQHGEVYEELLPSAPAPSNPLVQPSVLEPDREENITSELQAEIEAARKTVHRQVRQPDYARLEQQVTDELAKLVTAVRSKGADLLLVSNEVGMGLVPPYPMGRAYRDMLGRVNQQIAALADEVFMIFAGLPVELKHLQADLIK